MFSHLGIGAVVNKITATMSATGPAPYFFRRPWFYPRHGEIEEIPRPPAIRPLFQVRGWVSGNAMTVNIATISGTAKT